MSPKPLRVVQISDTHLLGDPAARLHGFDNQAALDAVLAHVRANTPAIDALLVTGDLVHDESDAGYRRLASQLRALDAPVYAIAGNHDHPARMAGTMAGVQVGGAANLGGWRIQLLDSHLPGSDAGHLGADQLAALDAALTAAPQSPTLVVVHHPAAPVGTPWLDTMRLRDGDALLALLRRHRAVCALVCGHVHQASDQRVAGTRQLTAPAVTRQFRPGSIGFAEDRRRAPGYRVFGLHENGRLTTRVRRVPAALSLQTLDEENSLSD